LPATKVGTFTQALYDEAKKNGWIVISMKNDWKKAAFHDCPFALREDATGRGSKQRYRRVTEMTLMRGG
jgi:hypothetical protein